jgi:DNA-directed RNA polymerase specialized sigma24 family protein
MSVREIAGALCVPEGTVKSRIHYAVRRLRSLLGEKEELEPRRGIEGDER